MLGLPDPPLPPPQASPHNKTPRTDTSTYGQSTIVQRAGEKRRLQLTFRAFCDAQSPASGRPFRPVPPIEAAELLMERLSSRGCERAAEVSEDSLQTACIHLLDSGKDETARKFAILDSTELLLTKNFFLFYEYIGREKKNILLTNETSTFKRPSLRL